MNSIVTQNGQILADTVQLRHDLMDALTDDDLAFALPNNPTLGELCRTMAEVEQNYIDSFKTFAFNYQLPNDTTRGHTVAELKAWYAQLEADLQAALAALSEEDIQRRMVDRGYGMMFPVFVQWQVYREALLIFYARAATYLRAMGKPVPQKLGMWVG